MPYQDIQLTCKDCGKTFTWTAGEQQFFAEKGLTNVPLRCPEDRKKKKSRAANQQLYAIICVSCKTEGVLSFEPRDSASVYCEQCFAKQTA